MNKAAITGIGGYVPDHVLSNGDLEKMVDTTDDWIISRTGIKERRILKDSNKPTSYLAIKAAKNLINKNNLNPELIDLVIVAINLTLAVDAGTYRIRVENPDGLAGLSAANFLTVSDAPNWSTGAGSLGSIVGGLSGAVATVSASGDSIVYSETTNVLTNASLAN